MSRLYEEFMEKNKKNFPKVQKLSKKSASKKRDFVIEIPLKSGIDTQRVHNDQGLVRVIQYEYAVRYLEHLNIEPNPKMID